MKNRKKTLIIIGITLLVLLVVLPAVAFSIVHWGILPPQKLTPLVEREVNKLIEGHLECDRIELTFFETYPRLGIKIVDGKLISHAIKDTTERQEGMALRVDSLLSFSQLTATIRPLDYLFKKQITIGEVLLENPTFYGYVGPDGKANWDIYSSKKDSVTTSSDSTAIPPFDLQKVRIAGGHFTYDDRQGEVFAEIEGFILNLKGSLIQDAHQFEIETGSSAFLFESPSYTLKNQLVFHLKSQVELRDDFHTVIFHGAEMLLNKLPFTADGSITNLPESNTIGMNLEMGLVASDMNELLQFVPEAYFKNINDIKATGSVSLEGSVHGELGDSIIPTINLCCKVDKGSFFVKNVKQGIDSLEMDLDLLIDGTNPNASYVNLEKLKLNGLNTSVDIKGKVTDLLQSPDIDAYMKGKIDFTRLAEEFLHPDTLFLHGEVDADIEASFRLDDLMNGKYNKLNAIGKLDIDTLIALSPSYDLDVFIKNAHFNIDSSNVTSRYIKGDKLLNATLTIDSVNVIYKDEINTNISRLHLTAKTSPEVDTSAVISVTSHIKADHLRARLPDSTWVLAKQAYLQGGIRPSASNKKTPNLVAVITVDSLRYFSIPMRTGGVMANSKFVVEALPYRDAMRQRFQAMNRDTTRVAARDTINRQPRNRRNTPQAQTDSVDTSTQLLRNWEVRGNVQFNQLRIFSRLFPLPMRMEKTSVKFDTNNVSFAGARFHAGKSNFTLTGDLNSIRRAMLRGGKLKGAFSVSSDYIDCDQLLQAISKGLQAVEQQDNAKITDESLVEMDVKIMQDSLAVAKTDSADMLFVVPEFLNMSLQMNAKEIVYKDLKMQEVVGEVVLRNQSINLKKLDMESNIGHANLTMFYTAKDASGASAGVDMEMQGILVEKLIDLYPSIDTLLPMLRSFEGIVDCQMMLTCAIDSTMSVVLPSINTACFLRGKDMVLLDGETFTEISKTLMFKNKERNVIDNISVDLVVKENKIEIFPFLVEMDRYRVAVGGTHNLDMTFDYHLSVLKSPVPFKLGIDITGNLDKFKYKITKCKYKNTFDPAKEEDLISTKTNIRESLRELIKKQIINNAPELASN